MNTILSWMRGTLLSLAFFSFSCAGYAQANRTAGELGFDFVGRLAAVGASGSKLYTTALRTETILGPGLRVQFYGTHRYGLFGVQTALIEKEWGGTAGKASAGLVRLPFGIYGSRETYGTGLIDYPLARGDYAYHSLDWGVPGIAWTGGSPNLQIEASAFSGKGAGIWHNEGQIRGAAARFQTYAGDAILGLSRWDGAVQNSPAASFTRPVHMTGLDLRSTKAQLLVRGEYLLGTLSGDHMSGWYLDTYYRLPGHAQWSLVGRIEALRPGSDYAEGRQLTLGTRYVAARDWTLAVNWRTNNGPAYRSYWTPNAAKSGDVFFQAYHRVSW